MKQIAVSDITLKWAERKEAPAFRINISLAKVLDRLGVDVIETNPILDRKSDYFLIKSLASAVKDSTVAVPVDINDENSAEKTWEALKEARKPRLQVCVPVSTVQMEYLSHRKPAAILEVIASNIKKCKSFCKNVEFVAMDSTRSDRDFLFQAVDTAVENGATIVSLEDDGGIMMPSVFNPYVREIRSRIPDTVKLGVRCSNDLYMADACAIAAIKAGADEIKTTTCGNNAASLQHIATILNAKPEECKAVCAIDVTSIRKSSAQINLMTCDSGEGTSPLNNGAATADDEREDIGLTTRDSKETLVGALVKLGYELSDDDAEKVYEEFKKLSSSNEKIGYKQIDAIAATVAYQVPPTYKLESIVINTGNTITPTCHIKLSRGNEILENVSLGDGPVDAAFLAVNKSIGKHYELDDFQVRSVTEGREALGETVIRLRHDGKIYSGRGVSKDIVASSVMAYLNAINKIAYEEAQA